eukprot:m51a1_g12391 putative stromal membrane-associated gtpase-activating protein 2 (754) ;mRNA; r:660974-663898
MAEPELIFDAATAAFTAFDFDVLYLTEIVAVMDEVSSHLLGASSRLDKLSKSFADYGTVLGNQERCGHTKNYVDALGDSCQVMFNAITAFGNKFAVMRAPLEAYVNKDVAHATTCKRQLSETVVRSGEPVASRKISIPVKPTRAQKPTTLSHRSVPSNLKPLGPAGSPEAAHMSPALAQQSREALDLVSRVSMEARRQILELAEGFLRSFKELSSSSTAAARLLEPDSLRKKEVLHASTALAPSAAKECNVYSLPGALAGLAGVEKEQIARLEELNVLCQKARHNPKSCGFELGEEEIKMAFGPLEALIEAHKTAVARLADVKTVEAAVAVYMPHFNTLRRLFIDMLRNSYQACNSVETSKKKTSFVRSHLKTLERFKVLRFSPIDYMHDIEDGFQTIVQIIGGADPSYPRFREAMVAQHDLAIAAEEAQMGSESAGTLQQLTNSIMGLENFAEDNRKFIGQADVTYTQDPPLPPCGPVTKFCMYLFSDVLAFAATPPKGAQTLISKGPIADIVLIKNVGADSMTFMWNSEANAAKVTVGFKSREEKEQWVAKISAANQAERGTQVFGVDLNSLYAKNQNSLPAVFTDALAYVLENGLDCEGIFRVNAPSFQLKKMQTEVDHGRKPDYVHAPYAAGLIKAWLRALPTPLLGEMYSEWLAFGAHVLNKETKPNEAKKILSRMTEPYYKVAEALFKALNKISTMSDVNHMSARNLAVVFTPTLMPVRGDMPTPVHFSAVEELIRNAQTLFTKQTR